MTQERCQLIWFTWASQAIKLTHVLTFLSPLQQLTFILHHFPLVITTFLAVLLVLTAPFVLCKSLAWITTHTTTHILVAVQLQHLCVLVVLRNKAKWFD